MMTAKINNGPTETKTRLVRWKRRVLGFEGAAVTPYSPISHRASLSNARQSRQPSHLITIAAGCCLSFDLSMYGVGQCSDRPAPQPVGDDTSGAPHDLQEGTNAFVAGSAEHVHYDVRNKRRSIA